MENADFVADDWNELDDRPLRLGQSTWMHGAIAYLENHQKASREYRGEVKGNAHSHMATTQPVPFSGRRFFFEFPINGEVLQPGENEAKQSPSENEP